MTNGDDRELEEQILSRFLDGLEDNSEVTEAVVETVSDLAGEDDFGGRDQLVDTVFEVKDIDAD